MELLSTQATVEVPCNCGRSCGYVHRERQGGYVHYVRVPKWAYRILRRVTVRFGL